MIKLGPQQIGFDTSYIMAATGDRVPTVFVDNDRVVNLDPKDPIKVSYKEKIGDEPTGTENPDKRKFGADPQHSGTITNGVSRIGWMSGGKAALWKDDELDDHVGAVIAKLEQLKLLESTIVIVSSDNGPVLFDGYDDGAAEKNGDHRPVGPFSGGKYSKLEGGTRVPLIVSWPGKIAPAVSDAATSQIDLLASFATLVGQPVPAGDSVNVLDVLLGKSKVGCGAIVEEGIAGVALRSGDWKFIPPHKGQAMFKDMRSGTGLHPQLYNLAEDPAESKNLALENPEKLKKLSAMLDKITGRKAALNR